MWPFKKKDMFAGHDLNKWNYLGYSHISFTYTDANGRKDEGVIFFFEHIKTLKRSYYLKADYEYLRDKFQKTHPYVYLHANRWKIGELLHSYLIQFPSAYCQEHYSEGAVPVKKVVSTEDNVINVDFTKK